MRQLVASLLTVALVAAACSSDGDSATAVIPAGDASAFCLGWPATRAALQDDLGDTNNEWEMQGNVEVARITLDEADARVPAALRSDWTSATAFQDTVITLLEIVDYDPERLPAQLIDAAFGEGGLEAAAAVSDASIARIDAWALDECGDFCELWPRLDRALGWVGQGGGDTHQSMQSEGRQDKAAILSAETLVPAAIRDDWDEASAIKLRLVDFYTSDLEDLGNQERWERLQEALGFGDPGERAFQAVVDEFGEPPPDVDHTFWAATTVSTGHRDAIGAWAADNCESVGVSGLPGVVRVKDPGKSRDRLLIAAMRVGTDLGEIEDASDFLAVACSHQAPGEVWESPLIERNNGFDQPCIDRYREDLGARSAVLAAGDYELFIGSFSRGVGNFNTYVPAPDLCVVVPITVDGDTEVTVPDLEPCDLGPLAGTAEEIARRQPPADTGGTTGTLRVTLTEHLADEGVHVNYTLAVLPAGTTLNQVALGDRWPVGFGCLNMDRPLDSDLDAEFEERLAEFEEDDGQAERDAAQRRAQHGEELERRAAQIQAEREEVERREAELGQLQRAEREQAEREIAELREQIEAWERDLEDYQSQIEEQEGHAASEAEYREAERQQLLSFMNPIREAIAGGGVPVPILPFPADPQSPECGGGPYELLGLNEEWTGPEQAQLPAGDYDVLVFVDLWNEEMGNESQRGCAELTVSVSGETVVKLPPLEECP